MTLASPPRFLSHAELDTVIRLAPLIAIDLIIRNARGEVLLGLRKNEPAKGRYFVPGGMILKNERLADAFARLGENETGQAARFDGVRLIGVFEHFYDSNRSGRGGYGTITSCSATNSNGRARPCRGRTISTANCGGLPWPSCWPPTACTTMPKRISAPRRAKVAIVYECAKAK